ncbi:MAG TPA: DegT/DnrJ/EryC1/StrS aminotransferase family protein [Planctomycetota bacterium]|nr:DegT/DnrJ/EryC1/StrS aminotransferase family protein [Planctomycetota bacterium]
MTETRADGRRPSAAPDPPRPAAGGERYVPFSPPHIGEEEIREAVDTLRSGWITTGPKTARFEAEFARLVGAPAALGLNSCTAGLHLSLVALGIGPGDLVATTPMTFAASVNVIEHVGATPLLVDVEPDTLNLSPAALRAALRPEVKAILAVHYAGHPADLDALGEIAAGRGLPVIEDAAHALPAFHRGRPIGSHGHLTAFSFYATKNVTTAEGGMLTGDPELIGRARTMSLHGLSRDAAQRYERGGNWRYEILAPGFKYNMTDLAAGLGLAQLRKLPGFQARRRWIVDAYDRAFAGLDTLRTPVERPECRSALHLYPIRLELERLAIDRDEVIRRLDALGVGTSVHFIPIHLHPYYRDKYGLAPEDFPVAYDAFRRLVSLPLNSGMRDEDVAQVIEAVRDVLARARR